MIRTPSEGTRTSTPRGLDRYRPSDSRSSGGRTSDGRTTTARPGRSVSDRPTSDRPSATRPGKAAVKARPISERYRPRDAVRPGTTRPIANRPTASARPGVRTDGRLATRGVPVTSAAIAPLVPNLAPRVGSPRLGAPASYAYGRGFGRGYVGWLRPSFGFRWNCWNGNWGWGGYGLNCYRPFGFSWSAGWCLNSWGYGAFNPWCWNIGVLAPYYAWHTSYWNNCYSSCYWNYRPVANALPASYWWYPTDVYCPTYLYVPSSTVIVTEEELEPVYGPSEEVIVAGGSPTADGAVVAGEAPAAEVAPKSEAMVLAEKYVELGDFYFRAGRYSDAAESYAKARNYLPEDASVHLVLADAVFANGDYHYAAFLVSEAVRLQPEIVTAETDKREFYRSAVEFEAQVEALQRYCNDKPYDAWAQLLLGYNLRFSDRPTRAIGAFRRVLELDRDNPTAQAFLKDLEKDEPAAKKDR